MLFHGISMESVANFNERLSVSSNAFHDERTLTFKPVDSVLAIESLRRRLPIALPDELVNLCTRCGAFESAFFADCGDTICVHSARELISTPFGLIDFIEFAWGGRPEFTERVNSTELAAANQYYVAFGYRYEDDDVRDYLYFDPAGRFGHVWFNQDDDASWEIELQAILNGSAHVVPLTELLQDQFELILNAEME
jgi:hypothetical protein